MHTILELVVEVFNMLVLPYPKKENIRKSFHKHFGKWDWTNIPIHAQQGYERSFSDLFW